MPEQFKFGCQRARQIVERNEEWWGGAARAARAVRLRIRKSGVRFL